MSSQDVSDPINSRVFHCALLACETDPVTCRPHVWLGVAQLREKDMPTPTAAHKNLIMASLVHLSFPSACHGLFLVVFVLFMVAANENSDSSGSGM